MNRLKSLGFIIVILATILVLIVVRLTNKDLFKKDASAAIEASKDGRNLITGTDLLQSNEYLVVDLNADETAKTRNIQNTIHIPLENLLDQSNQELFKVTNSKIVLYSDDISDASKAWVILNQLGFENLFIFQQEGNTEVFKYKFQPDTLARLE